MRSSIVAAAIAAMALTASGCGAFGSVETGSSSGGDAATSLQSLRAVETQYADEPFPTEETADAGCSEPETVENGKIENFGAEHVDRAVEYELNPPTSGSHDPTPLDWGVYEEPVDTERFVHNLEHGHLVIAHKGLDAQQYEALLDQRDSAPWHLVVTERDENPKEGVYYLAWDARVYCERPSEHAFQWVIDNYRDQAPEVFMTDSPKDPEELDELLQGG